MYQLSAVDQLKRIIAYFILWLKLVEKKL